MLKVADRVQEITDAAGINNILLQGAVNGYRAMSEAFSTGDVVPYVISKGPQYEIGTGTLTAGTPWVLSRDTVSTSSNGNQKILVEAGMFVFVDSTSEFLAALVSEAGIVGALKTINGASLVGAGQNITLVTPEDLLVALGDIDAALDAINGAIV